MKLLKLIVTSILLGFATAGVGVQIQEFRVRPDDVQVRAGDDVHLKCIVDNQQGKAQWTKDGFALGFEREVPGYPRYQYAGDANLGEHHLIIKGVTLEDDGEYQCQVGPTTTSLPIWAAANVTVMVAPRSIAVIGRQDKEVVEVIAGSPLQLECLVSEARPASSVAWYQDDLRIDPELQRDTVKPSRTPRLSSTLSLLALETIQAKDDGEVFSCRAQHPALSEEMFSSSSSSSSRRPQHLLVSVTLSVLHPPGSPAISGYQTGEVLQAGQRRTLTCRVHGGNPHPWVTWYWHDRPLNHTAKGKARKSVYLKGKATIRKGKRTREVSLEQKVTASRAIDGAVYECRVSSDRLTRPLSTNVTLTVHYAPVQVKVIGPTVVLAGENLTLTCLTSPANPPATINWSLDASPVNATKTSVEKAEGGGWQTSSKLTLRAPGSSEARSMTVTCQAYHLEHKEAISHTREVTIIRPPGWPIVEVTPRGRVMAGADLQVTCTSEGGHPPPQFRLYKGGREMTLETTSKGNLTKARVAFRAFPADNGAKIRCEVTNPASPIPLSSHTTLELLYPAWEIRGWMSPRSVESGQVAKLTCETSSSVPPSTVTWESSKDTLGEPSVKHSPGLYGGTVTRSKVKVKTQAEDNGRVFTCFADNGLGVTISANITLDVLHGPIWVFAPTKKLNVIEGGDLTITALAEANPGPVKYKWQKGREAVEGVKIKSGEGQLRLRKVHRHIADNYTVIAASVRGAINSSFTVNVQYGPENITAARRVLVEQNETATILCSASGNPTPNITWVRNAAETSLTLSSGVGEAHLMVEWATPADTGFYYCYASSTVASPPPVSTAVVVTQAPTSTTATLEEEEEKEDSEAAGRSWAVEGGNGLLDCRVRASPQPTFEWSTDDEIIVSKNNKYAIHLPQLMDGVAEWSSVLEIRGITKDDFTNYTCVANNPLGSYTSNYTLSLPTQPSTPLTLNVTVLSDSSVSVIWTDNTVGPFPSRYVIRYRTTGQRHYELVEVANINLTNAKVDDLTPGAEYSFTIQSYDEQGRPYHVSPPVVVNMSVVEDNGVTEMEKSRGIPFLIFLLIAVMGGALIILNVVGVICFFRRRSFFSVFSGSSSKTSAYEVQSPVDQLSLASSDDVPPPDYEQVMGSCRVAVYGGSLQDIIISAGPRGTPSGSRGTPSLARSSPMVTSSSTISGGDIDDDIIAPPDDFSNGLFDFSSGDQEPLPSTHVRHSWADLESDLPAPEDPTLPQSSTSYDLPVASYPSYQLPRPVGHVSAASFRSMESLAPLYTQRYEPQQTYTLPRRPSQIVFHGQPHIQQRLERHQLEQEQYQQQLEQQHLEQEFQYPQLQELSSSVDFQQEPLDEQYFLQQQQCCHPQPPTNPTMSVPPPYASLDPSTLYSLHSTFFDDGSRPSTSYSDWPSMTPTYPTRHFSES